MPTDRADAEAEWTQAGATLSDKKARAEYGLTQDEIVQAIRSGKLRYREASMHGNPWLRLLRREVEDLLRNRRGSDSLKAQKLKTELARIDRELRRLKIQAGKLQRQRAQILGEQKE